MKILTNSKEKQNETKQFNDTNIYQEIVSVKNLPYGI